MSITRQAYDEYMRGNFSTALDLFRKLSTDLSPDYFKVNVKLCLKRLPELFSAASSDGADMAGCDARISSIRLLNVDTDNIELNNSRPLYFRVKLPPNKLSDSMEKSVIPM